MQSTPRKTLALACAAAHRTNTPAIAKAQASRYPAVPWAGPDEKLRSPCPACQLHETGGHLACVPAPCWAIPPWPPLLDRLWCLLTRLARTLSDLHLLVLLHLKHTVAEVPQMHAILPSTSSQPSWMTIRLSAHPDARTVLVFFHFLFRVPICRPPPPKTPPGASPFPHPPHPTTWIFLLSINHWRPGPRPYSLQASSPPPPTTGILVHHNPLLPLPWSL